MARRCCSPGRQAASGGRSRRRLPDGAHAGAERSQGRGAERARAARCRVSTGSPLPISREEGAAERLAADAGEVDCLVANAGLPGDRQAGELLDRGDPAGAAREPGGADDPRAGARARRCASAATGISSSSPRCPARRPARASSVYAATKFGLRGFALCLRADLAGTGVGVSLVAPGFIRDAGMFADSGRQAPARHGHLHAAGGGRRRGQGDRAQQGGDRRRAGPPARARPPWRSPAPRIAMRAVTRRDGEQDGRPR